MLRALENFSCYPDGDDKPAKDIREGEIFDVENAGYAAMLISKGHAEKAGASASASSSSYKPGKAKGEI